MCIRDRSDVELLVLEMLIDLGVIDQKLDIYDLVTSLRVKRSKARSLVYNRALRKFTSDEDLKKETKKVLENLIIQKDGELFLLNIENPLVSDYIQAQLRKSGYVSDGSFSPNIVKLSTKALCALIEALLSEKERDKVQQTLILAGAPDGSFQGVVKSMLTQAAKKVAAEAGEEAIGSFLGYLSPILSATTTEIKKSCKDLFKPTS